MKEVLKDPGKRYAAPEDTEGHQADCEGTKHEWGGCRLPSHRLVYIRRSCDAAESVGDMLPPAGLSCTSAF